MTDDYERWAREAAIAHADAVRRRAIGESASEHRRRARANDRLRRRNERLRRAIERRATAGHWAWWVIPAIGVCAAGFLIVWAFGHAMVWLGSL